MRKKKKKLRTESRQFTYEKWRLQDKQYFKGILKIKNIDQTKYLECFIF